MDDTDIRPRVANLAPKAVSLVAFVFALLLIGLILAGAIPGQQGAAIGTLALAAMTALSVYSGLRQTRYMYEDLRFRRRPQVSIYHETGQEIGSGLLVVENTGEVPLTIEFNLALVESPCPSENQAKILDQTLLYADLPEVVRVQEGWNKAGGKYIEPKESTGWDDEFVRRILRVRGEEVGEGAVYWLRIDATLQSRYDESDSRSRKWLFEVIVSDRSTYVSVPFKRAKTTRKRLLRDMPEYDDPEST